MTSSMCSAHWTRVPKLSGVPKTASSPTRFSLIGRTSHERATLTVLAFPNGRSMAPPSGRPCTSERSLRPNPIPTVPATSFLTVSGVNQAANRVLATSAFSMSRSLVSRLFFTFSFLGLLLLLLVELRRLLLSTGFLFALCVSCLDASSVPVGVREESRCCYLSVGLVGQNAHAVIGTRCRRNG